MANDRGRFSDPSRDSSADCTVPLSYHSPQKTRPFAKRLNHTDKFQQEAFGLRTPSMAVFLRATLENSQRVAIDQWEWTEGALEECREWLQDDLLVVKCL
jgi:hypothetical protein